MTFCLKPLQISIASTIVCAGLILSPAAQAGVTYKDGDKWMELGGRIQLQYHSKNPSGTNTGATTDSIFFRRLRPFIAGSVTPDWKGIFQWDMGNENLSLKDAYMEYKGYEGIKVRIGNAYVPFSREDMTSSKKQQTVERTFVGDHNYGSPERNAGVFVKGHNSDKTLVWHASIGQSAQDPDNTKLDFDTPVQHGKGSDWSEGWMYAGRVDYHPLGFLKMAQGDFKREQKATISLAAFNWSNDNDNLDVTRTKKDVDTVTGIEVSGAYRNAGFSVDAEYNNFSSDLVENGINSGLYKNSSTTLTNWAIEGGYMVMPSKLEIVASYSSQDADGYATTWDRAEVGVNYFVNKQKIKYQLTYRTNSSVNGVNNNDLDEIFAQAQYVF